MVERQLKSMTRIKVELESTRTTWRKENTVRYRIQNDGNIRSNNIAVSILKSSEFEIIGISHQTIKILDPGDSCRVEFRIGINISVKEKTVLGQDYSLDVPVNVWFCDAEGKEVERRFNLILTIYNSPEFYEKFPNRYIPGIPLKTSDMFYGREKLFETIVNDFHNTQRTHVHILSGQKRTGKTSILYQLKTRLGNDFLPVFLDFQGIPDSGIENFLKWIEESISEDLRKGEVPFRELNRSEFQEGPMAHFRDIFLKEVVKSLGDRRLILMIDELESLHDRIQRGRIDIGIIEFMKNLVQHSENIDFIFSMTHKFNDRNSSQWSILFSIGLYHKIGFLERDEAIELIINPLKAFLTYPPVSIEKILEMTAGHPYFVQLLCFQLVNHQIRSHRNLVLLDDVIESLDEVTNVASPHFEYLWWDMTPMEQIVLLAAAELLESQSDIAVTDIMNCIQPRLRAAEEEIREILEELVRKEIMKRRADIYYRFKIELVRLWCLRNKSLFNVLEEKSYA